MARRVGNREERGSGSDVNTGNAHIYKEKEKFAEEKCATFEELQRKVQQLEEE